MTLFGGLVGVYFAGVKVWFTGAGDDERGEAGRVADAEDIVEGAKMEG